MLQKFLISITAIALYCSAYFTFNKAKVPPPWSCYLPTETTEVVKTKRTNGIQVALLLDTSDSMNGLIEQAKSQLWNILNELARTVKNGEETTLEIALYEYGNPNKGLSPNQINQLSPFTTDMDLISEKLFALTTNGGNEYCGTIIKTAVEQLNWEDGDALKIIYIAGNEAFTQGRIHYRGACQTATENSISVNTIFCGDYDTGVQLHWYDGAKSGNGDYFNINHNQETVYVPTPYDDKINTLNGELNKTYIPFGTQGLLKQQNQISQDTNAGGYGASNAASRIAFKSSSKYKNVEWDLVDAYEADKKILKKADDLPEAFQNLTADELEAKVNEVAVKRAKIQKEIQELDKKRRQFREDNSKTTGNPSLESSMIATLKKQAKQKGYEIKN